MLISIAEASSLSGIDDKTIYSWLDSGKLKDYGDGKKRLINKIEFFHSIPTVITLFNQKGGVGKTSISVMLADYFEKENFKILLIDLDPQTNLTQFYFDEITLSLYEFLEHNTALNKIVRPYSDNIDIIPASVKMMTKDTLDFSYILERKEYFQSLFKKYQIVIIDCPPTLNFLSRLGVMLSNFIIIPLLCEPLSYEGLAETLKTINLFKKQNSDFVEFKALINSFKTRRATIRESMLETFKTSLKDDLLKESLPDFIGVVERFATRKNIFDMYQNDAVRKIKSLFEHVEKIIYEDRGK